LQNKNQVVINQEIIFLKFKSDEETT